jgi:hypothetical protein
MVGATKIIRKGERFMEQVLRNGFCEMSIEDMMLVDGGNVFKDVWNEVCKGVTVAASGAVVGAKVGAATCTPVGVMAGVVTGAVVSVVWDYCLK